MFTHIIVGGGTAGCVIARRLSDASSHRVLLLEGGPAAQPSEVDAPSKWFGLSGTAIDWSFTSTPQAGAQNRRLNIARGKTLGGSSAINAMVHHRGAKADYDRWAALGATGWTAERLAPLFRRMETWRGDKDPQRGSRGPVVVAPVDQPTPAAFRFIEGAERTGHRRRADLNVDPGLGAAFNQVAFDGVHRMSSFRAYLVPILGRANLTVITDAQVLGLILEGGRCRGVRYRKAGEVVEVRADRDVVLCAGAIQSPQLLMLSGVGPAAELKALGIPPVVDAPGVGRNLHEHLIFPGVSIETRSSFPRSQFMGTDAVLYAQSRLSAGPRDIMVNFGADGFMAPGLESVAAGAKTSFAHMKPKSRGCLSLVSADPFEPPRIDLNALSHPDDLAGARDALAVCRAILNGEAFADMRLREVNPGPSVRSDSDIDAYLRRTALAFGHAVGTCRMGVDAEAVVDPDLRVYGLENVRVADASVIPEIPSAPTNATVLALAEMASDLLAG
jgi:choline dehydrogenase